MPVPLAQVRTGDYCSKCEQKLHDIELIKGFPAIPSTRPNFPGIFFKKNLLNFH
jgi:hypothetical protein